MYIYIYIYIERERRKTTKTNWAACRVGGQLGLRVLLVLHTCHILPPSEIDLGLCLAVFAGSGGKYIFHRIGRKGRIWQVCPCRAGPG